jgi:hypothetical protein
MGRRFIFLSVAAAAIGSLALSAAAAANLADEVQAGHALSGSIESGQSDCGELSGSQFDAIGEYAMARYVGDDRAHEAMNRQMALMTGETGEARMHEALGRRYSGCGEEAGAGWIASMAGMMGGDRGGFGPGMMAGGRHWGAGSGGMSTAAWVGILIVVVAGAVTATLWISRGRARGD